MFRLGPNAQQQQTERAQTPPGMVYVPGGECLLGSNDTDKDEDIAALHREYVPSFYMDRAEVTNAEYKRASPLIMSIRRGKRTCP